MAGAHVLIRCRDVCGPRPGGMDEDRCCERSVFRPIGQRDSGPQISVVRVVAGAASGCLGRVKDSSLEAFVDYTRIDPTPVLTDVPLVVEDLLTRAEELLDAGAAPELVEDLLAQVADLQGR